MTSVPHTAITVMSGECRRCGDVATHTSEPWSNQYRCAMGCRCTMQGCCPREPVQAHDGAPV